MDLARPELVLADADALDVLMVLARAQAPLETGAIGARCSRCADPRPALAVLQAHGIVICDAAGHRLNREHVLAMALEQLAAARGRLVERLRMHLGMWDPAPRLAALVGSATRGAGDHTDDVDLLLVRPPGPAPDPRWTAQVRAVATDIRAWTGNRPHIIELAATDGADLPADAVVLMGRAPGAPGS